VLGCVEVIDAAVKAFCRRPDLDWVETADFLSYLIDDEVAATFAHAIAFDSLSKADLLRASRLALSMTGSRFNHCTA
jgi:hypothetical protein